MEKCEICGEVHHQRQAHRFTERPPAVSPPIPGGVAARPKFDRNAYQREYMRRRRAKHS